MVEKYPKLLSVGEASPDELALVLRQKLISEEATVVWPLEVFNLVRTIAVIPCVDAFPIRWRDNPSFPEIGFIRRNTGLFKGKWWCIGGRLNIGESFSHALTRHVQEVLGVGFSLVPGLSWHHPVYVGQYAPLEIPLLGGENLGREPSKYCSSNTYLVELASEDFKFGSTAHGGQEAGDFRWFPLDELPYYNLAYGGEHTLHACAEWVRTNLP